MNISENPGPLFAALAEAQAKFKPVIRSESVTVRGQTKDGRPFTYDFEYAPLESIIDATREALSASQLTLTQLISGNELVTVLGHSSGAYLSSSVALPNTPRIQELGSAITYLRRYSMQAVLGIAAESDDDGAAQDGLQSQKRAPEPAPKPAKAKPSGAELPEKVREDLWEFAKKVGFSKPMLSDTCQNLFGKRRYDTLDEAAKLMEYLREQIPEEPEYLEGEP